MTPWPRGTGLKLLGPARASLQSGFQFEILHPDRFGVNFACLVTAAAIAAAMAAAMAAVMAAAMV